MKESPRHMPGQLVARRWTAIKAPESAGQGATREHSDAGQHHSQGCRVEIFGREPVGAVHRFRNEERGQRQKRAHNPCNVCGVQPPEFAFTDHIRTPPGHTRASVAASCLPPRPPCSRKQKLPSTPPPKPSRCARIPAPEKAIASDSAGRPG